MRQVFASINASGFGGSYLVPMRIGKRDVQEDVGMLLTKYSDFDKL